MPQSRLSVGNVDILVLHDAETALPLDQTFPNVTAGQWAPYQQQYPEAFDGADNLRVHFECYLIRSQGQTILVDTGLGTTASNPGTVATFGGGNDGRLLAELEAAGLQAGDVNTVFLSHLHPDHVGWNLTSGAGALMALVYLWHMCHSLLTTDPFPPRDLDGGEFVAPRFGERAKLPDAVMTEDSAHITGALFGDWRHTYDD